MPLAPAAGLIEAFRGMQSRLRDLPYSSAATCSIAGVPIRLLFGNERLRRIVLPAFHHLESALPSGPALNVYVCEQPSIFNGICFAPEPILSPGESDIWLDESSEMSVIVQKQGRDVTAVDWKGRTAYWLVQDADSISYLERARPLQQLLVCWLGKQGRYLAHAAAVGSRDAGVLILGNGGAGKSTAALACLEEGLRFVSDDYCLVSVDDGPSAHSIYGTAKLAADEMHRFPLLAPAGEMNGRPDGEKVVFFFGDLPGAPLSRHLELRAILLARIADLPRTRLRPVRKAEAFRAILASCSLHPQAARAGALQCFNGLVRLLPTYAFELGADLRSTPAVIRELLNGSPA